MTLQTLSSTNALACQAAGQVIAAIATIELPRQQWQDLMTQLVQNVNSGNDQQKQSSLTTIGFICESQDPDLRGSLVSQSNSILTAVVQGALRTETNREVRLAAITALGDSLDFVASNFKHEGERNYIMQVVCEATQAEDSRIQQGAFGCLNRIMALYYDNMRFYMEKALFGLTILGMKSNDEDVAKLAVEFWSTVCEEEITIEEDNAAVRLSSDPLPVPPPPLTYPGDQVENSDQMRPFYNFARVAVSEVVPVLLTLLAKQDEDATDDEYNVSRAAYQCLSLYANAVGNVIIPPVISFIEANLRHEDWHNRDAAVSAFGGIMEGPEEKVLVPMVKQALPPLIEMMTHDASLHVKDSTAYALGRITENCSDAIDPDTTMDPLIRSLFSGLLSNPKMAASSCWALMNIVERFSYPDQDQNVVSPHFNDSVKSLLDVTDRSDCDASVRTAAYEVLNIFVQNAAKQNLQAVAELLNVILKRIEESMSMQGQVVSVEDKIALEDMQTSLSAVLQGIITRLDVEVSSQGDSIMQLLLALLQTVGTKSSVPEAVFAAISALANAMEGDFIKYMDAFSPFLYKALANQDELSLCSMAIGLVGDITRSVGESSQPYCDHFMNYLLSNLRVSANFFFFFSVCCISPCLIAVLTADTTDLSPQSQSLSNQFKPAILQTFGDIAAAIGGHFEAYLSVVAQVLDQASGVYIEETSSYEIYDYVISLREGIMDAWGGIIGAMKAGGKGKNSFHPPQVYGEFPFFFFFLFFFFC